MSYHHFSSSSGGDKPQGIHGDKIVDEHYRSSSRHYGHENKGEIVNYVNYGSSKHFNRVEISPERVKNYPSEIKHRKSQRSLSPQIEKEKHHSLVERSHRSSHSHHDYPSPHHKHHRHHKSSHSSSPSASYEKLIHLPDLDDEYLYDGLMDNMENLVSKHSKKSSSANYAKLELSQTYSDIRQKQLAKRSRQRSRSRDFYDDSNSETDEDDYYHRKKASSFMVQDVKPTELLSSHPHSSKSNKSEDQSSRSYGHMKKHEEESLSPMSDNGHLSGLQSQNSPSGQQSTSVYQMSGDSRGNLVTPSVDDLLGHFQWTTNSNPIQNFSNTATTPPSYAAVTHAPIYSAPPPSYSVPPPISVPPPMQHNVPPPMQHAAPAPMQLPSQPHSIPQSTIEFPPSGGGITHTAMPPPTHLAPPGYSSYPPGFMPAPNMHPNVAMPSNFIQNRPNMQNQPNFHPNMQQNYASTFPQQNFQNPQSMSCNMNMHQNNWNPPPNMNYNKSQANFIKIPTESAPATPATTEVLKIAEVNEVNWKSMTESGLIEVRDLLVKTNFDGTSPTHPLWSRGLILQNNKLVSLLLTRQQYVAKLRTNKELMKKYADLTFICRYEASKFKKLHDEYKNSDVDNDMKQEIMALDEMEPAPRHCNDTIKGKFFRNTVEVLAKLRCAQGELSFCKNPEIVLANMKKKMNAPIPLLLRATETASDSALPLSFGCKKGVRLSNLSKIDFPKSTNDNQSMTNGMLCAPRVFGLQDEMTLQIISKNCTDINQVPFPNNCMTVTSTPISSKMEKLGDSISSSSQSNFPIPSTTKQEITYDELSIDEMFDTGGSNLNKTPVTTAGDVTSASIASSDTSESPSVLEVRIKQEPFDRYVRPFETPVQLSQVDSKAVVNIKILHGEINSEGASKSNLQNVPAKVPEKRKIVEDDSVQDIKPKLIKLESNP